MSTETAAPLAALLLAACTADTGFSDAAEANTGEDGVSQMEVTPTEIVFEDLNWQAGYASSDVFKVSNVGDNNLMIYDIGIADSGGGVFAMDDAETSDELELGPGAEREFTVVATLTENIEAAGQVRILCNDADNRDFRLPLTAIPAEGGDDTGSGGDDTGG